MTGMPRQPAVPLPVDRLPPETTELRSLSNLEVGWDGVVVVAAQPCRDVLRTELLLCSAEVREYGFARRLTLPQRLSFYDYGQRVPLWDTWHAAGFYTSFGKALPWVMSVDDV